MKKTCVPALISSALISINRLENLESKQLHQCCQGVYLRLGKRLLRNLFEGAYVEFD